MSHARTNDGEEPSSFAARALERACGGGLTGRPGDVDGCGLVRAAGAGARRGRVRGARAGVWAAQRVRAARAGSMAWCPAPAGCGW